jgi:hypothetical protein
MKTTAESKDNQIVSWAFLLRGHPSDLSLVHEMFHGVADMQIEREGSNYRLRSSRFNVPATAEEARSLAEEIIGEMNGAIKAFFPSREIILVGNTFGCRRDGSFLYYQENRVAMRSEVSLSMTVNGNPIPPQPPPLEPTQWFNLAQRDTNVADALRQFARSDEWFDIYKVYEIIRDDLGSKKLNSKKLASKTELDLLRQTANYYRHARTARPSKPMTHDDARELIRRVLRHWLEEKDATS